MKNRLETLKEQEQELLGKLEKIRNEIHEFACKEYENKYTGKYVRLSEGSHDGLYININNIWYGVSNKTYYIEGLMFFRESSDWADCCSFDFTAWNQIAIKADLIENIKFNIINKEEFIEEFNKSYQKAKENFNVFSDLNKMLRPA